MEVEGQALPPVEDAAAAASSTHLLIIWGVLKMGDPQVTMGFNI